VQGIRGCLGWFANGVGDSIIVHIVVVVQFSKQYHERDVRENN